MLYSSTDPPSAAAPKPDANAYQPFRVVDAAIVDRIAEELERLPEAEEEGGSRSPIPISV
jgi:hypothetical protein